MKKLENGVHSRKLIRNSEKEHIYKSNMDLGLNPKPSTLAKVRHRWDWSERQSGP